MRECGSVSVLAFLRTEPLSLSHTYSHTHTHTHPYSLTSHHLHRFVLPLLRLIRQCVAGADGIAATMLRSSCPESFLDCDHCQQPQL